MSWPVKEFQTFRVMLFTAVITELSWRSHATMVTFSFVILSSTPCKLCLKQKATSIKAILVCQNIFMSLTSEILLYFALLRTEPLLQETGEMKDVFHYVAHTTTK